MKTELALLVLCMLSAAALDQTYVQTVERDGSSIIEKTSDLGLLSTELNFGAFERMAEVCSGSAELDCSVDVEGKTVILRDSFQSNGHYSYESEYGLPFTTHTLTIESIPTDRFSRLMDRLFDEADATGMPASSVSPLYLRDKEQNREGAELLRQVGVTIIYTVEVPSGISEAYAGEVIATIDGNTATFDLVEVLEASEPMVVKSSELNYSYIILAGGIIVLAALAWSFMSSQPKPEKPQKKRRK